MHNRHFFSWYEIQNHPCFGVAGTDDAFLARKNVAIEEGRRQTRIEKEKKPDKSEKGIADELQSTFLK